MNSSSMIVDGATEARIAEELDRLQAKVREAATTPHSGVRARRVGTGTVIALALVVFVVSAGLAVLWWPGSLPAGNAVSSVVTGAAQGIVHAYTSVESLLGAPVKIAAPASAAVQSQPASPARPRKKQADPQRAAVTAAPAEPAQPMLPSSVLIVSDMALPTAPELPATNLVEPDFDASRVYSPLDAGATPPVPLYPQIGQVVTDASAAPGDMEVLVGPAGDVERVTLVAPSAYQDKMLIFAMKNRKFTPASAHGHPVRYLLRIRSGT